MSRQLRAFYLMRHAEVEATYRQTFGGRIDMELSKRGQVRLLADFLQRCPFDSCFSSPMKRAVQTAAPCRGWTKSVLLSGLREVDFGRLGWSSLGRSAGKIRKKRPRLASSSRSQRHPQSRIHRTLRARIQEIWNILRHPENGSRIGVFGHGVVIRTLLALLLQMPARQMAAFEFCYASVIILRIRENRPEVQLSN